MSHCPYLLAQYARYKGRDISATAAALVENGFSMSRLTEDCMRFPSLLSAPPDRIRGWKYLLSNFGVAQDSLAFAKMLQRAPFMYYTDPPQYHDEDLADRINDKLSVNAGGYIVYEALRVLRVIDSLHLEDMDKVVRTQPDLLMTSADEVALRIKFLLGLFLENQVESQAMESLAVESQLEAPFGVPKVGVLPMPVPLPVPQVSHNSYSAYLTDNSDTSKENVTLEKHMYSVEDRLKCYEGKDDKFVRSEVGTTTQSEVNYADKDEDVDGENNALKMFRSMLSTYPAVLSLDIW